MLYIVGTFFGMKPCGIVLCCYELFISESKSQVYGILHDVFSKWDMDEIGRCSFTKRERFIYLFYFFSIYFFYIYIALQDLTMTMLFVELNIKLQG